MHPVASPRLAMIVLVLLTGYGAPTGCGEEPEDRSNEPLVNTPPASDTMGSHVESVGGIMARRMESEGILADLLDAERTPERLKVTIRFRNVAGGSRSLVVETGNGTYDRWRLTAGGEEIRLLVDEFGDPEAPAELRDTLAPGETRVWLGTFSSPPEDVETFDLDFPGLTRPFTDVPIEDVEDVEKSLFPID